MFELSANGLFIPDQGSLLVSCSLAFNIALLPWASICFSSTIKLRSLVVRFHKLSKAFEKPWIDFLCIYRLHVTNSTGMQ